MYEHMLTVLFKHIHLYYISKTLRTNNKLRLKSITRLTLSHTHSESISYSFTNKHI